MNPNELIDELQKAASLAPLPLQEHLRMSRVADELRALLAAIATPDPDPDEQPDLSLVPEKVVTDGTR